MVTTHCCHANIIVVLKIVHVCLTLIRLLGLLLSCSYSIALSSIPACVRGAYIVDELSNCSQFGFSKVYLIWVHCQPSRIYSMWFDCMQVNVMNVELDFGHLATGNVKPKIAEIKLGAKDVNINPSVPHSPARSSRATVNLYVDGTSKLFGFTFGIWVLTPHTRITEN